MTEAVPLLELVDVSRQYQSGDTVVRALDGVSLVIRHGEFVAIMGQSGSGKSTLMNIIGCLDKPSIGTYSILGRVVNGLDRDSLATLRRDTFGFIFQRYNLLATASAEENVEIPAIYAGATKQNRMEKAKRLLEQLGLGSRVTHRPAELSGGQQQRVAIARALVNDPAVILADEPTGALDSKSGSEVMALLKALHGEGRTVILITHDEHVARNARRIVRLADGRVLDDAPVGGRSDDAPENADIIEGALIAGKHDMRAVSAIPELAETAKMAFRALRVNFFRTLLTLLGIIIGVASVVVMLAVGDGSKQKVLDQISAMGTNLLSIRPGAPGVRSSGDNATLLPDDAVAIRRLPNVHSLVEERSSRQTVRHGNIDYATSIQGTGYALPETRDWPMAAGNFFTERDLKSYAPVAILGQTVKDNLFPGSANPVGAYILVKNIPFEIIGVMGAKGASSFGTDQDDIVFIPYTTGIMRIFGKTFLNSITLRVDDVSKIDETQDAITALLIRRHRGEDFSIRNMASILETATNTQNTLTILLGTVAAISLLVGGIGVMNIMLVSVTERTREIGIRIATGARTRDIMLQFSTEAAVVCTLGGLMGVFTGFLIGFCLKFFDVEVVFSAMPVLLAFTCAVGTGLLFGYLPAKKAAALDPVIALASE
ncbi:MAG: MacB family efflux pump subunit [Alphaproteobacteria bacterium]